MKPEVDLFGFDYFDEYYGNCEYDGGDCGDVPSDDFCCFLNQGWTLKHWVCFHYHAVVHPPPIPVLPGKSKKILNLNYNYNFNNLVKIPEIS